MLQAADEVDDVVGALRLFAMGLNSEFRLVVAGSVAASSVYAALLRITG